MPFVRKATLLAACAALLAAACRGTVPDRNEPPERDISAILIGGRFLLPSGPTRNGLTHINFESGDDRRAEIYRLPVSGRDNALYLIEPGTYRLAPTRSPLGFHQDRIKILIEGRTHRIPFPRDLLRQPSYVMRPSKIVAIGLIEAHVMTALPGQKPQVRVTLDDSVAARRQLIQDAIRNMMDPRRSSETRESSISWSRALQNSLMEILAEEEKTPLFKPAP